MNNFIANYWPHLFFVISIVSGVSAAVHAVMTKDDVRAATGWVGVVILSPIIGAFIYLIVGINRIRQTAVSRRHASADMRLEQDRNPQGPTDVTLCAGPQFTSLKILVDNVSVFPLTGGNDIRALNGGDETYAAMLAAINDAQKTIALQSYIFDNDPAGRRIADALIVAHKRGVEIRVLIDAIGARYSRPPISRMLAEGGIRTADFMSAIIGMKLPYANLRSHRKLMVIDGVVGLTGGMNIRAGFTKEFAGEAVQQDRHFRIEGPAVAQLSSSFMHDWLVATDDKLPDSLWLSLPGSHDHSDAVPGIPARIVPSGPDQNLANSHSVIMGAITVAQRRICISSPYFLPDQQLIGALSVAARRGIIVDIVIPAVNNLKLVDHAMTAQLDQVIKPGCRIWRSTGAFDHSKLMTVDGSWSYIGSSNMDPRSLRLNFELDVEIYDHGIGSSIEALIDNRIETAIPETLTTLSSKPFLERLRNRAIWLASPYL